MSELKDLEARRDRAYREYIELDWQLFISRNPGSQKQKPMFENVVDRLQNQIHPAPERFKSEFELAIRILTKGQAYLTKEEPKRVVFYDDNAVE